MSAIGAIFSFREKPIDEQSLIALNNGMARHGKHGAHHWFSNQCGLTQQRHHFTSNAPLKTLPYFDKKTEICVAAHARLFNRAALQAALQLSPSTQPSDAELILFAYLKWDLAFVSHLVGELSLALWDKRSRRLVIAVDHFNTRPLYYFFNQDFLVVSSVLSALHGVKWVPRTPHLHAIARHDFKRFLLEPGETCFQDIHFLPPAHLLIAEASGVKFKTYWQPGLADPSVFQSEPEFQEAFEAYFSNAVRATLETDARVCLQLSGGLDSSAIALMANQVLTSEEKPLICLSNHLPPNNPDHHLKDEREYIACIRGKNLVKEAILDEWRGPFDHLTLCSSQLYTSPQHYQHCAINAAARRHQASHILHGTLAELTTSYTGYEYLTALFYRLRWITLIRELLMHRRIYPTSSVSLAGLLVHPNIRYACFRKRQNHVRQKLLTSSFINKSFVLDQVTPETLAFIENQFLRPLFLRSTDARENALTQLEYHLRHSSTLFNQMDDGIDTALYFSNPYFDKRLVEFCLNIPNEYRFKRGYTRSIIRVGMQKYFPTSIAQRITKSPFLPDYYLRYNQHRSKAKEMISSIQSHPLVQEVLDVPRLLSCLDNPSSSHLLDTETNFLNYHVVPQAVYLAVFLSSFS